MRGHTSGSRSDTLPGEAALPRREQHGAEVFVPGDAIMGGRTGAAGLDARRRSGAHDAGRGDEQVDIRDARTARRVHADDSTRSLACPSTTFNLSNERTIPGVVDRAMRAHNLSQPAVYYDS